MAEDERDFDAELAAVERFITDVQRGGVPTGEAMRAFRDVHRPAIERLRARLAEFEDLLRAAGVEVPDHDRDGDQDDGEGSGAA